MNAREVITEELLHMGSFIPHVEANNIIYRLRIAGFAILPRSEVEEKDKEIAELREALRAMSCPRPCNHRPDDFEVGQCFDAGECGCIAEVALAYGAGGNDGER